jgi:isoleucyl-tRNA synthetase
VNWCFDCGSALAEAEVEYEDRKDPRVDVGFAFFETDKLAKASARRSRNRASPSSGLPRRGRCPRTRRLNVHPEVTYNLVDTSKGLLILAADLQEACLKRYGLEGKGDCVLQGRCAGEHPLPATRSTTGSRRSTLATT